MRETFLVTVIKIRVVHTKLIEAALEHQGKEVWDSECILRPKLIAFPNELMKFVRENREIKDAFKIFSLSH